MSIIRVAVVLLALAVALGPQPCAAQAKPAIKIGGMCDRSGATQIIGVELCSGVADYIALVNRKGGVLGHRLDYTEIDHGYMVPRAVEGYQRLKRDGAVTFFTYGVPTLEGVAPYYMEDRIPSFNSGTGRGHYIDGTVWPYIFPGTASYWSQAGAAMKYFKDNGAKKGTRIAYLYYDNPAGRDGIAMVDAVAEKEGYVLRKYAVQPPGLEMEQQVTEIVREFKADWVITSLFGRPPEVRLSAAPRAELRLRRRRPRHRGRRLGHCTGLSWPAVRGRRSQFSRRAGDHEDVPRRRKGRPEDRRRSVLQPGCPYCRHDRRGHPARDPEPWPAAHR
jgi:branched-chain amino acid transport system substrate-binding protein